MKPLFKIVYVVALIFFISNQLFSQNSGDLDSTFGVNGQVVILDILSGAKSSLLQNDEKILLASTTPGLVKRLNLTRYLPNGNIDNSWGQNGTSVLNFNLPGSPTNSFRQLHQQADGKILGIGYGQAIGGDLYGYLFRTLENGDLDSSFSDNGIAVIENLLEGYMSSALTILDNRILTFSSLTAYSSTPILLNALHIRAYDINDGSIDSTWGDNGNLVHELLDGHNIAIHPHNPIIQTDQKLLIGFRDRVYRLFPDGQIDTDFGTNGFIQPIEAKSGGSFTLGGGGAAKLSFSLQQDGKILISGIANGYNNVSGEFGVIERYHPDGTIDNSFARNGIQTVDFRTDSLPWLWTNWLSDMNLQQDGSIIVSGTLSEDSVNYTHGLHQKDNYFAMRRYTPDGEIDSVFGENGLVITPSFHQNNSNDRCGWNYIQEDDKILLIGATPDFSLNLARYHGHAPVLEDTTVSNNNILDKNEIELFPNPVKDILNFNTTKTGNLEIYSLEGKLIESINITNAKNTINTQHLNNGVYLLRFYDNDGNQSVNKILKQ